MERALGDAFAHFNVGHRSALDDFHTTHLVPTRCVPGVYGIEWAWPE